MSVEATSAAATDRHLAEQVERANASGRTPAVFVHGPWLLPFVRRFVPARGPR